MNVLRCGIHGFHETLGLDVNEISFFWTLHSDKEDAFQTAYKVLVSTDIQQLSNPPTDEDGPFETAESWSSGKVKSHAQRDIRCNPKRGFRSTCPYYWVAIIWDNLDQPTTSSINTFFTAYPRAHEPPPLSPNQTYMPYDSLIYRTWFEDEGNRWKARWIGDGGDKPLYLRRSFKIAEKPTRAMIFVSGLGHYALRVNGQLASDHVLDPGWTNYHRTVQFVAHDLTDLLTEGENVLTGHLGNGFYAGDKGDRFFWPMYEDNTYIRYGNELPFLAELHLFYPDGNHQILFTDTEWRVKRSATTLANVYASETHDRRLYPWGWDSPGFDDSSWAPAKHLTGPRGQLRYQRQPPLVLHDTFKPVSTRTPRPGVVCFDLGQNMSTMVKIVIEGKAGSKIIVRYAESVHDDGTVRMPDPLFKDFETDVYSIIYLAGRGEPETWSPEFSFTSARYIQVEGVSLEPGQGLPVIYSAVGQHVSSSSRALGYIKTDKSDVNALLNACYWSFSSNLHSLHTDCPQIEKFGWLEVTHLLAASTQYMRDVEALYTKIIQDIIDTQEPNGLVPCTAPEIRYMTGPFRDTITWSAALILLPDILSRYYGSTSIIPYVYQPATRYLAYMRGKERRGGLIEHGLGDWGREIGFGNAQANIETAFYYKCLRCMEMFARHLGLATEASDFAERADRVSKVYNQHLLVLDDMTRRYAYYTSLDKYPTRDMTAVNQAIALQFNLVPPKHHADIMHAFLAGVADGKLQSGEVGLPYLFATLADSGRHDLVLQMTRQEEHPSYMRFIRHGETTLPEFWQDECRSKCHDMLGSILEWFYVAVLGVKPIESAYKIFAVKPPYISEFGHVEGTVDCPYGQIAVTFDRRVEGSITLELDIPTSTIAKLELPDYPSEVEILRKGDDDDTPHVVSNNGPVELRQGSYTASIIKLGT
ncbi:MAG: hypothetical protein M1834_004008 [Cirrosporium novae-zelandiae]|nr:MAG: hypothetical protein M1834_004008 [Cirrosporium novae-zelandiae]